MNITTILLIILSGIGFTVWFDLLENAKKLMHREVPVRWWFTRLRLHSRLINTVKATITTQKPVLKFAVDIRLPMHSVSFPPRTTVIHARNSMAKVVVFTPPAVPPGEPPINMSMAQNNFDSF